MNVILLIAVILTAALVHGHPCRHKSPTSQYNNFISRHILQSSFDTNSGLAWIQYLNANNLCGRTPVQSFINMADRRTVEQICSRSGRRPTTVAPGKENLCISQSPIQVYDINSTMSGNNCRLNEPPRSRNHRVIVACNKVGNVCLPVHYEKYNNQSPGNNACI